MNSVQRKKIFRTSNRDRNEHTITEILIRFQVPYVLMPASAGFDILVMVNPPEFWEIKNPEYKWSLTEAEQKLKSYCKRNGITYRVIEYIEQAVQALNSGAERK